MVKQAPTLSLVEHIDTLSDKQRARYIASLNDKQLLAHRYDWRIIAREKQLPPKGKWTVWMIMTGRGFGKTRAGGMWIHDRAMAGDENRRIALVSKTPADARDDMIHGLGGILKNTHPDERPEYEPSKRRLTWPTGAWATVFSGAHPEQARGFSGDTAWCDEIAAWQFPDATWENLLFGMREGRVGPPQFCITTTPKPIPLIKEFKKRCLERDTWVLTTGSSYENRDNLDPTYYEEVIAPFEGTARGRQEIHGELIEDLEGALWRRKWIEDSRIRVELGDIPPRLVRVLVGVDPQGKKKQGSETGIVAAGIGKDGHGYVLDDRSCNKLPDGWARAAVESYEFNEANGIVGETNFGADMVKHTIHSVNPEVPFFEVRASRGKDIRAEPISRLSEQGKIHHVGTFADLESELCTWESDSGMPSPNRLDAYVHVLSKLMLTQRQDISVGPIGASRASQWRIE